MIFWNLTPEVLAEKIRADGYAAGAASNEAYLREACAREQIALRRAERAEAAEARASCSPSRIG